jgi:type IV pilus assembly protein PilB
MPPIVFPRESDQQLALFLSGVGLISMDEATNAIQSSEESGKGIIETLVQAGVTNELQVAQSISNAYGLDVVHISSLADIDEETLNILPFNFIQRNRLLPFKVEDDGEILVAIADNTSLNMISSVRTLTNKSVRAQIMPLTEMNDLLAALCGEEEHASVVEVVEEEDEALTEVEDSEARSSVVIDFVDKMISEAVKAGVSDIHVEMFKTFARVRYRLDGVLHEQKEYADELYERYAAIVTRIKIMSSLDIAERRLPQDGAISLNIDGRGVDFRVSVLPTGFGERVVLRILDRSSISLTVAKLNLNEVDEKALIEAIESPQGLVLVTGPTGSGKSTTLYAALSEINEEGLNILTAEDPVEYAIDGVGQVQIKDKIGLTFSATLRSFLRQDPEVILVGEIRDKETVDIAVKAALTGHLVLSTLHTNDSVSTISRLLNMGVPPYLLTSSLTLIVAQRLVRTLCQHCKIVDDSCSADKLQSIGFSEEEAKRAKVYTGEGCDECNGIGAKGRRGIYEVLRMTDAIKDAILKDKNSMEILEIAEQKDNFRTMQAIGRELLVEGILSLKEYNRVMMVI